MEFEIYRRPESQRIWVVRAQGGMFVRHFEKGETIAIGHLDFLDLREIHPFIVEDPELKKMMNSKNKASKNPRPDRTISSHFNQVKQFVHGINIGDLVITVDSRYLMYGRIIGYAQIEKKPIQLHGIESENLTMRYVLRRKVQWGPRLYRKDIPSNMENTLKAHQAVFNIDKFWTNVYHLIYPMFISGSRVYTSLNIKQKSSIDGRSLAKFYSLMSDIELMSKSIADIDSWEDFSALERQFTGNLNLESKAEFMSPGGLWNSIQYEHIEQLFTFIICYIFVFGGEIPHIFKAKGIITAEMRGKILDMLLSKYDQKLIRQMREKLRSELPERNTLPLEDSSNDEAQ